MVDVMNKEIENKNKQIWDYGLFKTNSSFLPLLLAWKEVTKLLWFQYVI
jgi:hypothetical protein